MTPRATSIALLAGLTLGASAASAQQPSASRTVARLIGVEGNVLVSQADGMVTAGNGQRLPPGARILTTGSGKATVVYDKGCSVQLGVSQRYTVRERAECTPARSPDMGRAAEFGALAGAGIKNSGDSLVTGDLGVSPGNTIVGFPPGRVDGHTHRADADARAGQSDALKAYDQLVGQECNANLAGQDLGGLTLTPGVYCFPGSAATLTGDLILDPQGDPDAVFVFQIGTTLTTAANSQVRVKDGGDREGSDTKTSTSDRDRKRDALCNVYWQVGTSASLGENSVFLGNLFTVGDVSVADHGQVFGRVLARSGQVTLDTNVNQISCRPVFAYWPAAIGVGAALCAGLCEDRKPKSPN